MQVADVADERVMDKSSSEKQFYSFAPYLAVARKKKRPGDRSPTGLGVAFSSTANRETFIAVIGLFIFVCLCTPANLKFKIAVAADLSGDFFEADKLRALELVEEKVETRVLRKRRHGRICRVAMELRDALLGFRR